MGAPAALQLILPPSPISQYCWARLSTGPAGTIRQLDKRKPRMSSRRSSGGRRETKGAWGVMKSDEGGKFEATSTMAALEECIIIPIINNTYLSKYYTGSLDPIRKLHWRMQIRSLGVQLEPGRPCIKIA